MSAKKLAMVDNAAQAQRAAKSQPHKDIDSQIAPCPASAPELFIVPVRYALAGPGPAQTLRCLRERIAQGTGAGGRRHTGDRRDPERSGPAEDP